MDDLVEGLLVEFASAPVEEIDRALFRLRHEALYASEDYRKYREEPMN